MLSRFRKGRDLLTSPDEIAMATSDTIRRPEGMPQFNLRRKHLSIDSHSIRLPNRGHSCRFCRLGIAQIPWSVTGVLGRVRRRHAVGADGVLVGKHAAGGAADPGTGCDLASPRFSCRDQPAPQCSMDRRDPSDHAGRAGAGVWLSVDGSRLLLSGRDDRCHRGKGDRR